MRKNLTAGMISLALVLTATILNKMPAGSAAPVIDETGRPIPGSIASLEKVELGDMEQWILIRGRDASNPVLLWLHGGPGAAQMPIAGHFNGDLEAHFILESLGNPPSPITRNSSVISN